MWLPGESCFHAQLFVAPVFSPRTICPRTRVFAAFSSSPRTCVCSARVVAASNPPPRPSFFHPQLFVAYMCFLPARVSPLFIRRVQVLDAPASTAHHNHPPQHGRSRTHLCLYRAVIINAASITDLDETIYGRVLDAHPSTFINVQVLTVEMRVTDVPSVSVSRLSGRICH